MLEQTANHWRNIRHGVNYCRFESLLRKTILIDDCVEEETVNLSR